MLEQFHDEEPHSLYFPPNSIEKGKGKIHLTTGHEDAERDWRYSSILSLTSVVDEDA